MSDDLVKRLRNTPNWMREGFQDWKDNVRTYDLAPFEAADRIEELEGKLAKAVSFINHVADGQSKDYTNNCDIALSILAELKGHNDE